MGEALRAICGGPIGLRVAGAFDGYLLEIDSIDTAGFSVPIYSLFIYYLHVCMYIYIVCFILRVLLYRGVLRFKK